ncbi:MAG: type II CAAX prenyl endopeptidase Rce1 family protein [Oscillospiraceae bacterium]
MNMNLFISKDIEENIIDAAKDYSCPSQSDSFNESYRKWRSESKYGFSFVKDADVLTYIDGKGFVDDRPENAEKECLKKNMTAIGLALCIYFFIEAAFPYLAAAVLRLFGNNVTNDFILGLLNASLVQYTSVAAISAFLKVLTPLFFLIFLRKTPPSVIFPLKIINKEAARIAIPVMLMATGIAICGTYLWGRSLNIFSIKVSPAAVKIGTDLPSAAISTVAYIIIFPIIKELFLRGAVMQSLRQFGDGFALIFTSIVSAFICHDISHMWFVLLMSFCIGYITICTGSLLCGIYADIFVSAVIYFSSTLLLFLPQNMFDTIMFFVVAGFFLIGFILFLIFSKKQENILLYRFPKSYMALNDKLTVALISPPMLLWIVTSFVFMTIFAEFTA